MKRNRQGENIPSIHYLESLHQKHLDMHRQFESQTLMIDTTYLTPEEIGETVYKFICQCNKENTQGDDLMIFNE